MIIKTLKVAFLNVQSLSSHYAEFASLLIQEEFDIVGISETWLTSNISSGLVRVDDYNLIRRDRGSRGGGVAIYIRNTFNYKVLDSQLHEALEQIWIEIKLNKQTYIIGSLYRPPKKNYLDFITIFEDTLSRLSPLCDNLICGGDLNVDLSDHDTAFTSTLLDAYTLSIYNK